MSRDHADTPTAGRKLTRRKKLAFAAIPLLLASVLAELAARGYRRSQGMSPTMSGSYRDLRVDLIRRGYPAAHDPLLGFVPRPGFASRDNQWQVQITIDADGLRSNGAARPDGPIVLAAGDSFTFGDEVGDAATWPAHLERRIARPVANAGVFGYGLAQIVLRTERLLARLPIDTVVLSFIADDLARCELSKRFTPVPWFDLVDGALLLRGTPVPDSSATEAQPLRDLLGHSAALDMLFWNAAPAWWASQSRAVREHPPGTGVEIGRLLMERIADHCRRRDVPLLVVLQGRHPDRGADRVLRHAGEHGARTLDLVTELATRQRADPTTEERFFRHHMTAAGNAWVADRIADALGR